MNTVSNMFESASDMGRILGGQKHKIPIILRENYPEKVKNYVSQHGLSKELQDSLTALWLINSALSEDVISSPPQDSSIVEEYVNKWVVSESQIVRFYNKVVIPHFTD